MVSPNCPACLPKLPGPSPQSAGAVSPNCCFRLPKLPVHAIETHKESPQTARRMYSCPNRAPKDHLGPIFADTARSVSPNCPPPWSTKSLASPQTAHLKKSSRSTFSISRSRVSYFNSEVGKHDPSGNHLEGVLLGNLAWQRNPGRMPSFC